MEDILQESKHSLTSPGNHDAQMRLVVLVGLLILAIVVAVFVLNSSRSTAPVAVAPPADMSVVTPPSDTGTVPDMVEVPQLAGYVAGVITSPDNDAKWIELHVQMPKADAFVLGEDGEPPAFLETDTLFYKFYLADDVKGVDTLIGGQSIVVSFDGEPSETEYVSVSHFDVL